MRPCWSHSVVALRRGPIPVITGLDDRAIHLLFACFSLRALAPYHPFVFVFASLKPSKGLVVRCKLSRKSLTKTEFGAFLVN